MSQLCSMHPRFPCPRDLSLHGEPIVEHWWSGWPGAYCLKCGAEDPTEIALAEGCNCVLGDMSWA